MKNKPKPKEQAIQTAILQYLNLKGHFVVKMNNAGIMKANGHFIPPPVPGVADLIGCAKGGRYIAIEVKRPGNVTTVAQDAFLEQVRKRGGIALVAYSVEDVQEVGL